MLETVHAHKTSCLLMLICCLPVARDMQLGIMDMSVFVQSL